MQPPHDIAHLWRCYTCFGNKGWFAGHSFHFHLPKQSFWVKHCAIKLHLPSLISKAYNDDTFHRLKPHTFHWLTPHTFHWLTPHTFYWLIPHTFHRLKTHTFHWLKPHTFYRLKPHPFHRLNPHASHRHQTPWNNSLVCPAPSNHCLLPQTISIIQLPHDKAHLGPHVGSDWLTCRNIHSCDSRTQIHVTHYCLSMEFGFSHHKIR